MILQDDDERHVTTADVLHACEVLLLAGYNAEALMVLSRVLKSKAAQKQMAHKMTREAGGG